MGNPEGLIDLQLWLNTSVINRQNHLKNQFMSIFEEVGNTLVEENYSRISSKSRGIKISKGNDLLGFPYQVLDVIRDFDPSTGVNIRLLNWFGNGLYSSVFLGKDKINPIDALLQNGMEYGLSEKTWDYPDLILKGNRSTDSEEISKVHLGFHHWIRKIEINSDTRSTYHILLEEVKINLGILELLKE